MNDRRRATLYRVAATLAPADARIDRIVRHAAEAVEHLSPGRRCDLERLLDLLWLPLKASDASRAAALRMLASAPVPALRTGFAALKRLVLFLAYAESEAGSENPTWSRIGYPGPRHDAVVRDAVLPLAVAGDGERLGADVVVIGSGAGGGVAAAAFARAGKRVMVVEAGGAYEPSAFTQRELMTSELYLDRGLTSTSDLGIVILAGATVGGGTTVNWCTSLRLPEPIAAQWSRESGIADLGAELAPHYAAIEARLAIGPAARHNANNAIILDGARALGLHGAESPRNASVDCADGCGYCGYGCAYDKKRSTAAAYLRELGRGGAIFANATATRLLTRGQRAHAVEVRQALASGEIRKFSIEADLIVVCAGALRTPGLLARSGIAHPLLGKRLFLHPVAAAVAEFDHPIEPWSGPMQTAYSDAFNYRNGNYGAKIEAAPAHPGMAALALPWTGRAQHAELMCRLRNAGTLFALTRDRDPGSIELDDEASIRYRLSRFDGENLLAGLAGVFDLAFAAGAVRMITLHATPIEVSRAQWGDAGFRAGFARRLQRIGIAPNRQTLFSAHQMGTAAIGADRRRSVVDPTGCIWDYENVLVADASVFPQSSGVNPMLTIMAMAQRIAAMHGGAPV